MEMEYPMNGTWHPLYRTSYPMHGIPCPMDGGSSDWRESEGREVRTSRGIACGPIRVVLDIPVTPRMAGAVRREVAMAEILEVLIPWAVSTTLLFVLFAWDERRMSQPQRDRAWPPASLRVAVVYFGILSLLVHFGRTRRSVLGLLQGLAWTVAFALLEVGIGEAVEAIAARALSP
jgi:hypothetical protein